MRVGDSGASYYHTLKKGEGRSRFQHEQVIDAESFYELWSGTKGLQIEKVRYVVQEGAYRRGIDRFLDRGLWIAEVECPAGQKKAPPIPEWLAPLVVRDVSEDAAFKKQALAH